MHVIPIPGRQVPDPEKGGCLPPQGRPVSDHDQYWLRRIADGDVTVAKPQTKPVKGQPKE